MTPALQWTSKSLVTLSEQLAGQGHEASPTKVRALMRQDGWRLQSNSKLLEKREPHPNTRDFRCLAVFGVLRFLCSVRVFVPVSWCRAGMRRARVSRRVGRAVPRAAGPMFLLPAGEAGR